VLPVAPGTVLPGVPGVVLPGVFGVVLPRVPGLVVPGVLGIVGLGVPGAGALGVWATAADAKRIRLATSAASDATGDLEIMDASCTGSRARPVPSGKRVAIRAFRPECDPSRA